MDLLGENLLDVPAQVRSIGEAPRRHILGRLAASRNPHNQADSWVWVGKTPYLVNGGGCTSTCKGAQNFPATNAQVRCHYPSNELRRPE